MGHPANALSTKVAAAVVRRSTATLDTIGEDFPGTSREQLQKALTNAKARGLVSLLRRGSGRGCKGGSIPSIWGAPQPEPKRQAPIRSVWELSNRTAPAGTWPPAVGVARRYSPLGAWTEEGPTA